MLYSSYTEYVKNDQIRAKNIRTYLHEAIPSATGNIMQSHASHGEGIIVVHSRGEMKGYIQFANCEFSKISGYTAESLKNLSLSALVPDVFRQAHSTAFEKSLFILESGNDILKDEKKVFMLHKSQFIVPIKMKIVEYPNFSNDFNFLAAINLDKERNDCNYLHILLDSNYVISAMSSRKYFLASREYYYNHLIDCITQLDLKRRVQMSNNKMTIHDLIPLFNTIKRNVLSEVSLEGKKL